MELITLEYIRDERRACYTAERLAELYDRPHTPLEVLTRTDGPWASVPAKDRLWTVLYQGLLSDKLLRLFACDCAERALTRERKAGREPDPRSWNAIEVSRRFARGEATQDELTTSYTNATVATVAARAYAAYAAYAAARAAADADAIAANATAAADAARAYAADAAYAYAATDAVCANVAYARASTKVAYAAERYWQVKHLAEMIRKEQA